MALSLPAAAGAVLHESTDRLDLADAFETVIDPGGTLTPDRVVELASQAAMSPQSAPRVPLLNVKPDYTLWVKIDVAADPGVASDWRLVVGRPTLDRVRLFKRADNGQWIGFPEIGAMVPFSVRPVPHAGFVFPVEIRGGESATFLLRVQETGSAPVVAALWRPEALAAADRTYYGLRFIYVGMLAAMLLYNLVLSIVVRDKGYVLYIGLLACTGLGVLSETGLAAEYLWGDAVWWNNRSQAVLYNGTGVFLTLFTRHFFSTRLRAPALDAILRLLGWALFFGVGAAMLSKQAGVLVILVCGSVTSLTVVATSVLAVMRRWPGAAYFFSGSLMLQAGLSAAILRFLALLPPRLTTADFVALGSAIEMVLFALALANRINEITAAKDRATAQMKLYAASLNSSADLVFFVDRATLKFIDANEAALAATGFSREELLLRGPGDMGDRPGAAELAKAYDELIARAPATDTREAEFRRRDGTIVYMEVRRQAIFLGGRWLICVNARDISEKRRAAEELRLRMTELTRSNAELEQFAYVASHDLSEPLRMVASFTQLIEHRYGAMFDKDGKEFFGYVVSGAQRMKLLLDDLLKYSRVSRPKAPDTEFSLDDSLDDAIANLAHSIESSGGTIRREPLPRIVGQRSAFAQLFQNLIGNALKFRASDAAPVVHVSARDDGDEWVVSVRDNGIGIAPQYFERIFVIFQRLHPRDVHEGTGIGLAICKKVAERHGGRIDVESAPGAGSTFLVRLPKRAAAEFAPARQ